jgi:hypothetical protein
VTTTEEIVLIAPSGRRQPLALCVAVGAVVTVGWVLYRHYWSADVYQRLVRWDWFNGHFWAVTLLIALVLCVPYALALLVWGRGLRRAVSGATAALGVGIFFWGWDRIFQDYVWDSGPATPTTTRIYLWGSLLGIATLVPLAWGLARRSGRGWLLGIVVGPVVAAILRELQLQWSWWHDRVAADGHNIHWQLQAVAFVAPFVLGALACWAIEVARTRRTPEMGSAA